MKYDERACKFNMDTGCVELRSGMGEKFQLTVPGLRMHWM